MNVIRIYRLFSQFYCLSRKSERILRICWHWIVSQIYRFGGYILCLYKLCNCDLMFFAADTVRILMCGFVSGLRRIFVQSLSGAARTWVCNLSLGWFDKRDNGCGKIGSNNSRLYRHWDYYDSCPVSQTRLCPGVPTERLVAYGSLTLTLSCQQWVAGCQIRQLFWI